MTALGEAPPDGKRAIRAVFSSAEGLFRLMFPNSPRLTAGEVQKHEPLLQQLHAKDQKAKGAASKLLHSFKGWIDAAHFYRHEAGQEEPAQPPLTLTVQMVSVGASFVRWLAELDIASPGVPPKKSEEVPDQTGRGSSTHAPLGPYDDR